MTEKLNEEIKVHRRAPLRMGRLLVRILQAAEAVPSALADNSIPDPDNLLQLHPRGSAVIEPSSSTVGMVGQLLGGLEASTIGQKLRDACCSE